MYFLIHRLIISDYSKLIATLLIPQEIYTEFEMIIFEPLPLVDVLMCLLNHSKIKIMKRNRKM